MDRLQKSLKSQGFDVVAIEGFSSDFGGTAKDEMDRLKVIYQLSTSFYSIDLLHFLQKSLG